MWRFSTFWHETWSLRSDTWSLTIWSLIPGVWHMGPGTWHMEPGILHLAPGIRHLGLGTCTPGTWNLKPGSWHLRFKPATSWLKTVKHMPREMWGHNFFKKEENRKVDFFVKEYFRFYWTAVYILILGTSNLGTRAWQVWGNFFHKSKHRYFE